MFDLRFWDKRRRQLNRERELVDSEKEMKRRADAYAQELRERAARKAHIHDLRAEFDGMRFRWVFENWKVVSQWHVYDINTFRTLIDERINKEDSHGPSS